MTTIIGIAMAGAVLNFLVILVLIIIAICCIRARTKRISGSMDFEGGSPSTRRSHHHSTDHPQMGSLFHWVVRCKWCMWGSLGQWGLHPLHHWRPAVVTWTWHIPSSHGLLGLTPLPLSVLTLQQVSHLESDECNCYAAIQTVQGLTICTIYSLEVLGQDTSLISF